MKHETIVIDRMAVRFRKILRDRGYGVDCEFGIDQIANEFAVELFAFLASKKHEETERTTIEVHADWWEAFRDRWFPRWWLGHWPVKFTTVETLVKTTTTKVCPHINTGKDRDHIRFLMMSPGENEHEELRELFRLREFVRMIACGYESDNRYYLGHECSLRVVLEAKKVLGIE